MASFKKNLIYQTAYQVLATVLPLITTPYVSRVLGATNLGIYSYAATYANYFAVVAMLGFSNYGGKSIAGSKADTDSLVEMYFGIRKLQLISSSLMMILYVAFVLIFQRDNLALYAIEAIWIINCFIDVNWFFFGLEEFKLTVTRNLIIKLLSIVGIFAFVRTANDLLIYALILVIGTTISDIYLLLKVKKWIPYRKKVSIKASLVHLKPVIVLFVPILAMTLYHQMDKTMLGLLSTYEEVGYYYNADKIINILLGVITGLGTVSLPRMTALLAQGKKDEYKNILEKSVAVVMIACSAVVFGITAVSEEFVPLFFGEGYEACIPLLSKLSFVIYFKAIGAILVNQVLLPHDKEKAYIIAVFAGAGVNFVANSIMIRLWGALGAVIATIIAEFLVCVVEIFLSREVVNVLSLLKNSLVYPVVGLLMFISVRLLMNFINIQQAIVALTVEILFGAGVFCMLCIFYWRLTKDTIGKYISSMLLHKFKRK